MKVCPRVFTVRNGAAPAKNVPGGSFGLWTLVGKENGCDELASVNWYGSARTSNNPKPPRTAVFPFRNGSQAKPTRGSKFRSVGFRKYGSPKCAVEFVILRRLESLPWTSV